MPDLSGVDAMKLPDIAMTPTLEHVFARLVDCARKGERCPTGDAISAGVTAAGLALSRKSPTTALALAGRIRVRVHAHNWRVVEILEGPHAGKETKAARWGCYLVIDRDGRRRVER